MESPAATRACPASTAFSPPGCTANPAAGAESMLQVHSPSMVDATDSVEPEVNVGERRVRLEPGLHADQGRQGCPPSPRAWN